MAAESFAQGKFDVSAPGRRAAVITPHDSNEIPEVPRAIYVGTGGQITMRGIDGSADTVWKNVPAGSLIPFRPQYVRAAGTTAADLLAIY